MHPHQATLEKFHSAFARLDVDTIATCYAPNAAFGDEAFSLRGHDQVMGMVMCMWRMLCDTTSQGAG